MTIDDVRGVWASGAPRAMRAFRRQAWKKGVYVRNGNPPTGNGFLIDAKGQTMWEPKKEDLTSQDWEVYVPDVSQGTEPPPEVKEPQVLKEGSRVYKEGRRTLRT